MMTTAHRLLSVCISLTLCAALGTGCSRSTHTTSVLAAEQPGAETAARIERGKLIFDQTPKYAAAYVGNQMACGNCHLQSGTVPFASPLIDVAGLFPMFSKRAGRTITLEDRIQECFTRSENGHPLPHDSEEMRSLTAYINSLSRNPVQGVPFPGRGLVKLPELAGDPVRGQTVYAAQCASCHGAEGAGIPPMLPPVWGPGSYNDGAGMDTIEKAAAFVQHNMPQNQPGSLTPQQAFDVAAFLRSKPRPKFNPIYKQY